MNLDTIREDAKYTMNSSYSQAKVLSKLYIGDCIRELNITFEKINKNLEKIANKDFNINTNNYTTQVPKINDVQKLINDHAIYGSNNTKNLPKC